MKKGSDSRVKEDYPDNPDNPDKGPKPIEPIKKNYGTDVEPMGCWDGVKVRYEIRIKPDKNERLGF